MSKKAGAMISFWALHFWSHGRRYSEEVLFLGFLNIGFLNGQNIYLFREIFLGHCLNSSNITSLWSGARLSKGPFTQAIFVAQLDAIFVAPKLQLQYRTCKPAAISAPFYRRDIAGVSNLFETWCNFAAILDQNVTIVNHKGPLGRFCRSQFAQPRA